MKFALPLVTVATIIAIAAPAIAADCETETRSRIETAMGKTPLEAGVADAVRPLLSRPQYFEDAQQGAVCSRPKLDAPLYPGIPVKTCTYQRLGLTGWVMVANPSADVVAKWIANACAPTADAKTCAVRLTVQAWCTSQFSFPVAGNLITPVSASDGRTVGANTAFLHGVTIARPSWLDERTPVSAEVQQQRLAPLADSDKAFTDLAGRAAWPAGVAPEVYAKYAAAPSGQASSLGAACPALARRPDFINASRAAYNQAWRNGRNPMFDVAAKATMAGEPVGGARCM